MKKLDTKQRNKWNEEKFSFPVPSLLDSSDKQAAKTV
jgi:hypothetical protein